MKTKRLFAVIVVLIALATVPAYSQFPAAPGNESTGSFGSFKILVEPSLAHLFTGCPGWDATNRILSSPLLYDPATVIGVSAATTEGTPAQKHPPGVPVGTGPSTNINDTMFHHPEPFPDPPPATREVHTQIRSLNLRTYPASPTPVIVSLAAGVVSPGEVESESPSGNPANDFPARSFFDVYTQITIPACGTGGFTGATLYNRHNQPLVVQASNLTSLPPTVVYEHNASSEVPILFAGAGRGWKKDEFLGCIILAGHQVGVAGTPEAGGKGPQGKGPERVPPGQAAKGNEEFERHREAFERHMQEAERHMSHECKGK